MKEVNSERFCEIMAKAHSFENKDIGLLYLAVALIVETGDSPAELLKYMEDHFMKKDGAV